MAQHYNMVLGDEVNGGMVTLGKDFIDSISVNLQSPSQVVDVCLNLPDL